MRWKETGVSSLSECNSTVLDRMQSRIGTEADTEA